MFSCTHMTMCVHVYIWLLSYISAFMHTKKCGEGISARRTWHRGWEGGGGRHVLGPPPPKKRGLPGGNNPPPPPPPPPCPWGGLNVDVLNYTHKYRTRNRVSDRGQGRGRQREGDQPWSWWVCCGGGYTIYILYKTEGDQKWSSWVYSL
jgi:hypothetical protein